jgi:hypothetical protein
MNRNMTVEKSFKKVYFFRMEMYGTVSTAETLCIPSFFRGTVHRVTIYQGETDTAPTRWTEGR